VLVALLFFNFQATIAAAAAAATATTTKTDDEEENQFFGGLEIPYTHMSYIHMSVLFFHESFFGFLLVLPNFLACIVLYRILAGRGAEEREGGRVALATEGVASFFP